MIAHCFLTTVQNYTKRYRTVENEVLVTEGSCYKLHMGLQGREPPAGRGRGRGVMFRLHGCREVSVRHHLSHGMFLAV